MPASFDASRRIARGTSPSPRSPLMEPLLAADPPVGSRPTQRTAPTVPLAAHAAPRQRSAAARAGRIALASQHAGMGSLDATVEEAFRADHRSELNRVVTLAGAGFAQRGSHVYQWNNGTDSWDRHPEAGIAAIRLGANGHAYARTRAGELVPLTGGPAGGQPLPARTREFTVTPGGTVVVLEADIDHPRRIAPDGSPQDLLRPPGSSPLRSLAAAGDGWLHALTADGRLYRAHLRDLADPHADARIWQQTASPDGGLFAALKTLPDGRIAGVVDHAPGAAAPNETVHALDTDGRWHAQHADTPTGLQKTYGQFVESRNGWSNVTLGSPLTPGAARLWTNPKPGESPYVPAFVRSKLSVFQPTPEVQVTPPGPGLVHPRSHAQSVADRHGNYVRAHYGVATERGATNAAIREHLAIGGRFAELVAQSHERPFAMGGAAALHAVNAPGGGQPAPQALLRALVGERLVGTAETALDRLEDALRQTDAQGRTHAERFAKAMPPEADPDRILAHRREDNVLHELRGQIDLLFPKARRDTRVTDVLLRLDRLIHQQQLKFPHNEWPSLRDDPARAYCGLQLGKLAHDVAVACEALSDVRAAQADAAEPGVQNGLVMAHAARMNDPGHGIFNRRFAQFASLAAFESAQDARTLDQQLRQDFDQLQRQPLLLRSATPPQAEPLRAALDGNAADALGKIELALGLVDAQGRANPDWRASPTLREAQAPRERVFSAGNVLYAMLQRRRAALHGEDPQAAVPSGDGHALAALGRNDASRDITARLEQLLDRGVFLACPRAPQVAEGEADARQLGRKALDAAADGIAAVKDSWAEHNLGVLTGKLVHDQRVYEEAARALDGIAAPAERRARVDDELRRMQGEGGDPVSRLYGKDLWDARVEGELGVANGIAQAFRHPDHVLNRAARFQGMLGRDHAPDYVRMVSELKPGDSLKLEHSWMVGIDGDGWSHNWTPADRFKEGAHPDVPRPSDLKGRFNIALNKVPNILPVPSASLTRSKNVVLTKRTDGIDISFGNVTESEWKLLAAKLKWGAGEYRANEVRTADGKESHSALGLVFFGAETVPAVGVLGTKSEKRLKLSLANDDLGTVPHVVNALFSGNMSAEDLIDAAAHVSYARSRGVKLSNSLDVQALMAVVGIFTPPENLSRRAKMVGAGVEQLTGSLNFNRSTTRTQDAGGVHLDRPAGWAGEAAANRKFISVTELQGSWIKELPAVSTLLGKTRDIRIGDGYEMEHKVPPWIDLQIKDLFGPTALYRTPSVEMNADGSVVGVGYHVSTTGTFNVDRIPQLAELEKSAPEIVENMRIAAAAAREHRLPVDAAIEMTPQALAALNAARGHTGDARVMAEVNRRLQDPSSWRIRQVGVTSSRQYNTTLLAGASLFRYKSDASNTHTEIRAAIELQYPEAPGTAAPTATVRGDLTRGGGTPKFDQLDSLLEPALAQAVYGIGDPTPQGATRRMLAGLPRDPLDERGLRRLAQRALAEAPPGRQAHFALVRGQPVLRFPDPASAAWQQHALPASVQTALFSGSRATPRQAQSVLQLMAAGASGVLRELPPPSQLLDARLRAALRAAGGEVVDSLPGRELGRPGQALHVMQLLAPAADPARRATLGPAQRQVLASWFPGGDRAAPDWRLIERLQGSAQALAAFRQSLDKAAGMPVSETAARADPLPASPAISAPSTPSVSMPSASGAA